MQNWMVFMDYNNRVFFRLIVAETLENATMIGLELSIREKATFLGIAPFPEQDKGEG